jgi:cardiolipin synthase A/B
MRRRSPSSQPITRRRLGAVALGLIGLGIILLEALRATHRQPHLYLSNGSVGAPAVVDAGFTRALELATGMRIDPGNRVSLLLNGDGTYPLLWRDLADARRSITMQMYYALPGRVSDTLARILCDRARHDVEVRLLLDAFGSAEMPRSWRSAIGECGVHVALLRGLEWFTIHSATERSHVRAVVVDGRLGYTGGFGLADYWVGDGHHRDQWRETNVRFEGPAVGALQAAFAAAWRESTGEWLVGETFFPASAAPVPSDSGRVLAGVLFAQPTTGTTSAEQLFTFAILGARSRLYITNSYFVPNADFRRMLTDAAERGVDVRVLTVGPLTDVKTPWLAGRSYYESLRAHGVRVYEYQPAMMHAKTIVVDGRWSTIGSMNFDNHSFALNDESNLVVFDSAFAAKMESVFFDDLACAKEMTPSALAARSIWQRALEAGAAMLSRIL